MDKSKIRYKEKTKGREFRQAILRAWDKLDEEEREALEDIMFRLHRGIAKKYREPQFLGRQGMIELIGKLGKFILENEIETQDVDKDKARADSRPKT
jgi:hypothetical protein